MFSRQPLLALFAMVLCLPLLGAPADASGRRSAIAPPLDDQGRPVYPAVETMAHRQVLPAAIGLCPSFQAPADDVDIAGFRLGLPWTRSWNMTGLDLSLGLSEATGSFSGLQFSGLLNRVGADGAGLLVAGLANEVVGDMTGFQVSALLNEGRTVAGVQVALVNRSTGDTSALQLGFLNDAGCTTGLQLGAIDMTTETRGAQIGLWTGTKDLRGLQLGAINLADRASGCQFGVINVAGEMAGFQLGLWNDARRMSGIQIGLANHIGQSPVAFLPLMNVCF